MGNDIEIRVRVANNTATGLAAVNRSLNRLRDEARDAGRGLDGLTTRAAAASIALRSLKDAAQDASRALRSLNTAARNADGRLSTMSDRSRTLRRDTDDLDGSMQRLAGTMGGLRGNMGSLRTSSSGAGNSMDGMRKAALLLSPALLPIAAAAAPIAANLAAAGVAVGAFALAVGGQVAAIGKAAEAEKKYKDAVKEHGRASSEAAKAETAYLRTVRDMDPATRRAAAAFSVFKDSYQDWTQSLAKDTMPVVTKGFAVFGGLLPRLTPMVRATSGELDRLMTVLAGGVNSSGFEQFMDSFAQFASGALSKATDGLVRFMRVMSGGAGSSQFSEFMAYARDVGPQVGQTLGNLAKALTHMVAAASETGVGILTVVNAFARLVNAIPTDVLSTLLQFVVVFKAVKLAALGLGGVSGAVTAFGASLAAMRAAAAGAGGGLVGLAAAFGALSRAAKVAVISTGIGALVVALASLAELGQAAPPDVDKMTTSLGKLAQTGKLSGEASRVFGQDFDKLGEALGTLARPSNMEATQQFLTSLIGMDSTPVENAKEAFEGLDKSLTAMVRGGKAELAAEALKTVTANLKKQGFTSKEVKSQLDGYKAALADQALEQQLAAQAMGLFGQQAQATSEKLAAQKASADGLRQSIEALNDVNRNALGGMIGFEAAIDTAAKAARDNAGSLDMVNGKLDVNSPKAQAAATALNDLASRTKDAALAARESGDSWESVNGIYDRGRSKLMAYAQQMGLSKGEAAALADQILKIPDKKTQLKMDKEDAEQGLKAFNSALKRVPGAKSVTLKSLSKGAEAVLESFGLKVKRLPNGKVTVTAKAGQALSSVHGVKAAVDSLYSKTITITAHYRKDGASFLGASGRYAAGGKVRGYASGGDVQAYPDGGYVQGPGSGTSDDIVTMLGSGNVVRSSNTEFIVNARQTAKHRRLLELINSDQLPRFARGGVTKAEREARRSARGELTLSYFGARSGNKNTEFANALGAPDSLKELVSALNRWRSIIKKATHGGLEENLLKKLASAGRALTKYEKQHEAIVKTLEKAKALRDSVKSGVLSATSITQAASGEGQLTTRGLMASMVQDRDKATAFATALKDLRKKGVDKNIIKQIADAGIDGGGLETAGALLTASSSEIKSINALQSQISKAASKAGNAAADAMYGAGLKAGDGIIAGLEKKQDAIEKAMLKIAKSMEKAIKKALGIKSPSKVMEEVGDYTAEGFAVGMKRNRSVTPAWESMLNTPNGGRSSAAGGVAAPAAGAPAPFVLQVKLGNRDMGEVWVDVGRKEVKAYGSIEAALKPRR